MTREEILEQSRSRLFTVSADGPQIDELASRVSPSLCLDGEILDSKFTVLSPIGEGGMGAVYRVRHNLLGVDFALKLLKDREISIEGWQRFQREASLMARVSHPAVVRVYDFGVAKDRFPYYTMELLAGYSLEALLDSEKELDLISVLSIFLQAARAFSALHGEGIVHRDIKPSNLFLRRGFLDRILEDPQGLGVSADSSVLKILDFGIASLIGDDQSLTKPGTIFGSPLYMSPEQALGRRVEKTSDIYSLGCSLFCALSRVPPYLGDNALRTIGLHLEAPIPVLSEKVDFRVPKRLDVLLLSMLSKEPLARPTSMSAVAAELESILVSVLSDPASRNSSLPSLDRQTVLAAKTNVAHMGVNSSTGAGDNTANSIATGFGRSSHGDLVESRLRGRLLLIASALITLAGFGLYFFFSHSEVTRNSGLTVKSIGIEDTAMVPEEAYTQAEHKSEGKDQTTRKTIELAQMFPLSETLASVPQSDSTGIIQKSQIRQLHFPARSIGSYTIGPYNKHYYHRDLRDNILLTKEIAKGLKEPVVGTGKSISLYLSNAFVKDPSLLAGLKDDNIDEVYFDGSECKESISDEALRALTGLRRVKALSLINVDLDASDSAFNTLGAMPELMSLTLVPRVHHERDRYRIAAALNYDAVSQFKNLNDMRYLELKLNGSPRLLLERLASYSMRMKILVFRAADFSGVDFSNFASLQELRELNLYRCTSVRSEQIAKLGGCADLQHLRVASRIEGPSLVEAISAIDTLRHIDLVKGQLTRLERRKVKDSKPNLGITMQYDITD